MDGFGWHHLNPFIKNGISKTGTKHLATPDVKQHKVARTARNIPALWTQKTKQKQKSLRVSTLISKLQEGGWREGKNYKRQNMKNARQQPGSGRLSRECILTTLACMGWKGWGEGKLMIKRHLIKRCLITDNLQILIESWLRINWLLKRQHGLPWWSKSKGTACQGRRHRFHPCSGKTPCLHPTKPMSHSSWARTLKPLPHSENPCNEKSVTASEAPLLSTTREESLNEETKTHAAKTKI